MLQQRIVDDFTAGTGIEILDGELMHYGHYDYNFTASAFRIYGDGFSITCKLPQRMWIQDEDGTNTDAVMEALESHIGPVNPQAVDNFAWYKDQLAKRKQRLQSAKERLDRVYGGVR